MYIFDCVSLSDAVRIQTLSARRSAGLTQSQLAEVSGVSRSTIQAIEQNRPGSFTLSTVESLFSALGIKARLSVSALSVVDLDDGDAPS